ncbi:MAG: hypothetical protein RR140_00725 [Clostridia bacterium]
MNDKKKLNLCEKYPILEKLKSIKHIKIYCIVLACLLIAGIFGASLENKNINEKDTKIFGAMEYAKELESKLSNVLSQVEGAGKVKVMVVLESGSEFIYASTKEDKTNTSGNGSSTSNTSSEPIIINNGGTSTPIIIKEYMPKVSGVIIVAEGGSSIIVKMNLLKAVQALLAVPSGNIEILVGKK